MIDLDLTTPAPRSGRQIHLELGEQRAVIADVGAKLREYAVGGRDVVTPFDADEPAPAGHGAVLAPWPNRVRDGVWSWEGQTLQLDVSEPQRNTALHGLVLWQRWAVLELLADGGAPPHGVRLALRLSPSPGYPFDLHLVVTYRLTPGGLEVVTETTNLGSVPAPFGIGFHPWLSPGPGTLDECIFRLDAATRVTVDDRLLPTGTEPASGTYDLRSPRPVRDLDLDDAYVDVLRDDDGLSWARLTGADGRTAAVWMDGSLDAWQVCTGDHIDAVPYRRTGLAAEPMTCVADALRTGDRLVHLEPGTTHTVRWGLLLTDD